MATVRTIGTCGAGADPINRRVTLDEFEGLEALPAAYIAALRDLMPREEDLEGLATKLREAVSDVRGWIARPNARQTASSGR